VKGSKRAGRHHRLGEGNTPGCRAIEETQNEREKGVPGPDCWFPYGEKGGRSPSGITVTHCPAGDETRPLERAKMKDDGRKKKGPQ